MINTRREIQEEGENDTFFFAKRKLLRIHLNFDIQQNGIRL